MWRHFDKVGWWWWWRFIFKIYQQLHNPWMIKYSQILLEVQEQNYYSQYWSVSNKLFLLINSPSEQSLIVNEFWLVGWLSWVIFFAILTMEKNWSENHATSFKFSFCLRLWGQQLPWSMVLVIKFSCTTIKKTKTKVVWAERDLYYRWGWGGRRKEVKSERNKYVNKQPTMMKIQTMWKLIGKILVIGKVIQWSYTFLDKW